MTPKKFFYGIFAVNALLLLGIVAGVYFGGSLIKQQADKLMHAKVQSKVIEEQQVQLTQAKNDIQQYNELDTITKAIVPQDKDQAKTVREITKIASESGVTLKGIAFPSSSLGQSAPPTASSDGSASSVPAAPKITQVTPVDGITGVYALEIVVTSLDTQPVPYNNFITFLQKLEDNRRTAHVDKITVKPTSDGGSLSFALTLNAYVKP